MRAARYYGVEDIRVEDVPEPTTGPGQLKVSPAFVGICGTDLHEFLGGPNFCPVTPHALTGETIPVTLGHELSGTIIEVGECVNGFKVGQRCIIKPTLFCGKCIPCDTGAYNVCHKGGFVGLSGGGGGFSDALCVREEHVFALPDNVPFDIGALVEPLAVAWHAISAAPEVRPDSVMLVMGGGPIGLATILCLKARGVKQVIVSELASSRQKFASEFGASRVINPLTEDLNKVVMEVSSNRGADVVFDCAGVPASIKAACHAVKTKGAIVNVAIWEKEIPFNPNWITFKESTFTSVLGYKREDYEAVLEALKAGTIQPGGMITRKVKLEDIVEEGFKMLINDKDNQVKVLVDIGAK